MLAILSVYLGVLDPPPPTKSWHANGCNKVTNKYVLNIEIGVFEHICTNFASELAQTYFLEFDVLSLAYIRIIYIVTQ